MADDGTDCPRSGDVAQEPGVRSRSARDGSFDAPDYLSPPGSKHFGAGDHLRDAYDSAGDASGSVSLFPGPGRSGPARFMGEPGKRGDPEHRDLSVATDLPRRHDGIDALLAQFSRRRSAGRPRSPDEKNVMW